MSGTITIYSALGEALIQYWHRVASARGFAIDRVTIVPDHTHLLVRIAPKMSTEECALALLNNGQHFVGQHAPQSLIQAKIEQLWQASAYAGTTGKVRVGWTLTIPQLPLGGFERVAAAGVGWTLTIPQLPLGGFRRSKKAIRYSIRKAI